jgi:hypothetical protein
MEPQSKNILLIDDIDRIKKGHDASRNTASYSGIVHLEKEDIDLKGFLISVEIDRNFNGSVIDFEKNINNLSIESCFSYLNSTIALFPNGDDILVLKYIQMKEIDDIIAKHLKLEDYSYYDNSDLPYEEFKEGDEEYVSEKDWEKRLEDWNKVLLKNQNSIPSQNSIQLNLEWDKICSVLEFLNKEENNHFKNFKVNLIRKKDKSIDMEM